MTIEQIRKLCLSFPGVYEDIKWGDHLCFNVGGKMFLVTAPDNSPVTASFKASDEDFGALPERDGFIPAPYMAKNKWIFVDSISRFSPKEWEQYLKSAYNLIVAKLPARTQASLRPFDKLTAGSTQGKLLGSTAKTTSKPKAARKSKPKKKKKASRSRQ